MAKFKCNLSGNIFEFVHEWDVEDMKTHPQYTEVIEDEMQNKETTKEVKKTTKKSKAEE
jgi:hypothetical protein